MHILGPNIDMLLKLVRVHEGEYWRARWLDYPEPLDDTGSRLRGGRFNSERILGALYFAETLDGSLLEVALHKETLPADATAYLFKLRINRCLDLTEYEVRKALVPEGDPVTLLELTQPFDFSITHVIGGLAFGMRIDAMIVPSAAWHRFASTGKSVEYFTGGITISPPKIAEFSNLVVFNSVTAREMRRIEISRLNFTGV